MFSCDYPVIIGELTIQIIANIAYNQLAELIVYDRIDNGQFSDVSCAEYLFKKVTYDLFCFTKF